ncbi:hypothetical protein RRG08_018429 [Elysia crispata]|uniref:Uncharacterized protein n=1 Tax=Elysia crispata TaxID=231223 RepID=A0AAE1B9T8_9GAST|nr:hypothetical protein RRG08_018429 [Elysia crispata]
MASTYLKVWPKPQKAALAISKKQFTPLRPLSHMTPAASFIVFSHTRILFFMISVDTSRIIPGLKHAMFVEPRLQNYKDIVIKTPWTTKLLKEF